MPKGSGLTKPMKLSIELADIVGKKEASRAECIKQLWAYIKKNNLQDPENKQFFNPDKKMAKVNNFDFQTNTILSFLAAKNGGNVHHTLRFSISFFRSSATTGFVLSVWPSSWALTSHRHWTFFPNNFHFHPFTKFIYNSSNSTPISKNGRQRT